MAMPGIRVCELRGWYSDLVLLGDRIEVGLRGGRWGVFRPCVPSLFG
jgi:hypothetical protein